MSGYPHLAQRLYNAPLLITPAKAEVIEAVFRAHVERTGAPAVWVDPSKEAEAAAARHELAASGFKRSDGGYLLSSRGVALIPIIGSLMQRAGGMDAASGLEGYNRIAARLEAALADPNVRGIMLEIDSPGGEANGAFALHDAIAAASQTKPVWAMVNEQAFSAAYLLASAAEQIHVPESGLVGSVGVIMMHLDQSAADAKKGNVYTPIYAGARKADFSQHAPLSDAARSAAQSEVDRVYEMFVRSVAKGRGIDAEVVRGTEAGLLSPGDALGLGMIDGVSPWRETLSAFETAANQPRRLYSMQPAAGAASTEGVDMSQETKGQPAAPQNAARTYTETELAQAATAARGEGHSAGVSEGAKAASARIAAILGSEEAKGREKLAQHLAFDTDRPAAEALKTLEAAAKETPAKVDALAAAMGKIPNPKVGAAAEASETPRVISAAEVFARRRREAGHAH